MPLSFGAVSLLKALTGICRKPVGFFSRTWKWTLLDGEEKKRNGGEEEEEED